MILRLGGETLGIVEAVIGVGGGILIWATGRLAFELFPLLRVPFLRPFLYGVPLRILLAGLTTLGLWLCLAALSLLWHYLLAELVIIFKGIYKNTRGMGVQA